MVLSLAQGLGSDLQGELIRMTRCFWLCHLTPMLLLASVATGGTSGTEPSLIPWPAKVVTGRGVFVVNGQTPICARGAANSVAQQLQTTVRAIQGLDLETRRCGRGPAIELVLSPSASVTDTEGYTLDVSATGIRIEARAGAGLFYGAMTAAQLLSTDDRAVSEGIPSGGDRAVSEGIPPRWGFPRWPLGLSGGQRGNRRRGRLRPGRRDTQEDHHPYELSHHHPLGEVGQSLVLLRYGLHGLAFHIHRDGPQLPIQHHQIGPRAGFDPAAILPAQIIRRIPRHPSRGVLN
jgi:Glycosyl hydrolase family 20, domain 2